MLLLDVKMELVNNLILNAIRIINVRLDKLNALMVLVHWNNVVLLLLVLWVLLTIAMITLVNKTQLIVLLCLNVLKLLLFYVPMELAFLRELTAKDLNNAQLINQLDALICSVMHLTLNVLKSKDVQSEDNYVMMVLVPQTLIYALLINVLNIYLFNVKMDSVWMIRNSVIIKMGAHTILL